MYGITLRGELRHSGVDLSPTVRPAIVSSEGEERHLYRFCRLYSRLKYDRFKIPYQRRGLESRGQLRQLDLCATALRAS